LKFLGQAFDNVKQFYGKGAFIIDIIHSDMKFRTVEQGMKYKGPRLNPCSAKDHQPVVKGRARVVKEKARKKRSQYPYQLVPRIIIVNTLTDIVRWINFFFEENGITWNEFQNVHDWSKI
jgi:hypothetical protein